MLTRIKTADEIIRMRQSGKILATVLQRASEFADVGTTGKDISELVRRELKGFNAKAAFEGFNGFSDVLCISVNDAIVHGIPTLAEFRKGDIVSFDFGVTYDGMISDSAQTIIIGEEAEGDKKKLLEATESSLSAGIAVLKNDIKTGDIGAAVSKVLDDAKLGIVRELVGHGVGHEVHEGPDIPNYGTAGTGATLKAGMTVAIEPMATLGGERVVIDPDGWTIRTRDGSLTAHFEHTVLITEDGAEILTKL